jgi:hypothetical protein
VDDADPQFELFGGDRRPGFVDESDQLLAVTVARDVRGERLGRSGDRGGVRRGAAW